jgi:lambda family phage portal protein
MEDKRNWLDKAIEFISPKWGTIRRGWRSMNAYDAGHYDRVNNNWQVFNESAETTDRYNRDTVRARARDLERNSDMMNAVVSAFKRNVIGGGYHLQAKTADESVNNRLEYLWQRWCKKQNCDVTGTQSFSQIIRMCVQRKKVDGGILIAKRYTSQGFIPLQLQLFEVDELDICQSAPRYKGNRVVGGVEYNSYNRPVGYYIRQYDIDGSTVLEPIWIDAKDIIFYYSKRRPSQVREMPDMSPTITRIRDTNEFMVAVSVKERIAACLAVFIKKVIPTTGLGRNQSNAPQHSYQGKTIAPGMIRELNAGDEIQVVNPSGQATDATSYIKLQQRLIGSGQGISYEATSRDMSETNYSSARQGIIEDEMTYAEEVELVIELLDEIYESFVISCYLAGKLEASDFWGNKEEYFEHIWVKAPKKWIDPYKEANANKIALATGQKTFKQIAAENGQDWRDVIDDMAEAIDYAKEKGIDLGGVLFDREYKLEQSGEE